MKLSQKYVRQHLIPCLIAWNGWIRFYDHEFHEFVRFYLEYQNTELRIWHGSLKNPVTVKGWKNIVIYLQTSFNDDVRTDDSDLTIEEWCWK